MKAIAISIAMTGLLAVASAEVAAAEEIGIKDFVLGGDLRAEAARAGLECDANSNRPDSCSNFRRTYSELGRTIAGVPAKSLYFFGFDNKLGWIRYVFDQRNFTLVRAAFLDKYPALQCVESTVQNRMGATFEQTVCSVASPAATLTIRRRSSDLSEGSVEVQSAEFMELVQADIQRKKGAAKKDI